MHVFTVRQLKRCPLKNGEANKAYKAAVIISIPYPGGECDTACQRERPHQSRTFCREPALQQSQHEAQVKMWPETCRQK